MLLTPAHHTAVGRLLGYTEDEIDAFLARRAFFDMLEERAATKSGELKEETK